MLRSIIAASLVAAAAPVFAQSSDTTGMTPPAQAPDQSTIIVENTPEQAALADRAVPAVAATTGEIKLAVDTEWFKFDLDRSGGLDQAEFGAMLRKFRKAALAALKNGPDDAARANAAAFITADTDKNGKVDRDEFVGLLQSPAA